MSNELTPFKALKELKKRYGKMFSLNDDERCRVIKTALRQQEEDKKLLNEQAKSNRYLMEQIKQSNKKLKALDIIKNNFKLIGNCLHAKNEYAGDGWVFVKEIENEEELIAWKEVLL